MARIEDLTPGALFRHYKNKDYEVITLATEEATQEPVVVYRTLYGKFDVWTRRVSSFCETVDIDNKKQERFRLIKPEDRTP